MLAESLSRDELHQSFADAYRSAALGNADMRAAVEVLESLRSRTAPGADLEDAWNALDDAVGAAESAGLRRAVADFRTQFETAVRANALARLRRLVAQDPEAGFVEWLRAFGRALAAWRVELARAIADEPLPFAPARAGEVALVRTGVAQVALEHWPLTIDLFADLAGRETLDAKTRAFLSLAAGQIHLYHFLRPDEAKASFDRAAKWAPAEARVICAQGEYWLSQNRIDLAEAEGRRAVEQCPTAAQGHLHLGACAERREDLRGAEGSYHEAIRVRRGESEGYRCLMRLYGRPDLYTSRKPRVLPLAERAIAACPRERYGTCLDLASIHQQNNEFEAAHECYAQAQSLDPARVRAWLNEGNCFLLEGKRDDARRCFEKAVDLLPADVDGWRRLAMLEEKEQRWDDARRVYEKSLAARPEWEAGTRAKIAGVLWNSGAREEAEKALDRAIALAPFDETVGNVVQELAHDAFTTANDPVTGRRIFARLAAARGASYEAEYQNLLGNLEFETKAFETARVAYEKAVAADPNVAVYRSNLAGAHRELKHWDEARTHAKAAFDLHEDEGDYRRDLALVANAEANDLFARGLFRESIPGYEQAVELAPDDVAYRSNLSGAHRALKHWEEARKHAKAAFDLHKDEGRYRRDLAFVHNAEANDFFARGLYRESLPGYEEAVALAPGEAVFRSNLSGAHRELKQWDEARKHAKAAFDLHKDEGRYRRDAGTIRNAEANDLFARGLYRESIPVYAEAVSLAPDEATFRTNLAGAHRQAKNYDEARTHAKAGFEIHKDERRYRRDLAFIRNAEANDLFAQGLFRESIPGYEEAVELAPEEPVFRSNLAGSHRESGDFEEARKHARISFGLHKDEDRYRREVAFIHNAEGNAFFARGRYRESIPCYETAIGLAPDDSVFRSNLAGSHRECGNFEEARKHVRISFDLHKDEGRHRRELASIHNAEGNAFVARGRIRESIPCYEAAAKLDPAEIAYRTNLAASRSKLGEKVAAGEAVSDETTAAASSARPSSGDRVSGNGAPRNKLSESGFQKGAAPIERPRVEGEEGAGGKPGAASR